MPHETHTSFCAPISTKSKWLRERKRARDSKPVQIIVPTGANDHTCNKKLINFRPVVFPRKHLMCNVWRGAPFFSAVRPSQMYISTISNYLSFYHKKSILEQNPLPLLGQAREKVIETHILLAFFSKDTWIHYVICYMTPPILLEILVVYVVIKLFE